MSPGESKIHQVQKLISCSSVLLEFRRIMIIFSINSQIRSIENDNKAVDGLSLLLTEEEEETLYLEMNERLIQQSTPSSPSTLSELK